MQERRGGPLKRTLRNSKIVLNHQALVFDRTIRNLSSTGARIELARTAGIPDSATRRHWHPAGG